MGVDGIGLGAGLHLSLAQSWAVFSLHGLLTLHPRRPTLCMQAHELNSQSQILFGIGEEGGEPIHGPAQSLRTERLLQVLVITSLIYLILGFPSETEHI